MENLVKGDKILRIKEDSCYNLFKKGEPYTFDRYDEKYPKYFIYVEEFPTISFSLSNFQQIKTEKMEKKEKPKFKIGDKVIPHSKSKGDSFESHLSRCGDYKFLYIIDFDKEEGAWECWPTNTDSYGDYFLDSDLTLYQEPKTPPCVHQEPEKNNEPEINGLFPNEEQKVKLTKVEPSSWEEIGEVDEKGYEDTFNPLIKEVPKPGQARVFESGMKRDNDENKPYVHNLQGYTRLRFGYLTRMGARNYGDGNFLKGSPSDDALKSLDRHLAKFLDGDRSEDHLAAMIFNIQLVMLNEKREGIKADHYFKN